MKKVKIWFTKFAGNELDLSECSKLDIVGRKTEIKDGFYWITDNDKIIGINMNLIVKIEVEDDEIDFTDEDIPF